MIKYAIVVAGGSGTRMKSKLPKQFIVLEGKPVLMHTLNAFHVYDSAVKIIVALPETHIEGWKSLCKDYKFDLPHLIVKGGHTRFHSVKNALKEVKGEALVAIHDGVRPLVNCITMKNCYETAHEKGNAIPCVNIPDSIRYSTDGENNAVNRDNYKLIQTPPK